MWNSSHAASGFSSSSGFGTTLAASLSVFGVFFVFMVTTVGVCWFKYYVNMHRSVHTRSRVVDDGVPAETTTVVMTTPQNNTPASNHSAEDGGDDSPPGYTALPSYPTTGYLTTGYQDAPPPYPA